MLKIALICGGPSLERGISLNSARSVLDHLPAANIEVIPVYVNRDLNFYRLSTAQLYSNTPSDFDFKLENVAQKLTEKDLVLLLKQIDLVFSVIHGAFGEDGEIQKLLEKHHIPYIGSNSVSCHKMFNKYEAAKTLKEQGYPVLPTLLLDKHQTDRQQNLNNFFTENKIERAVVKPVKGGSSIGVYAVLNAQEAEEKCLDIFQQNIEEQVLVEPFCQGTEFTIMVLENKQGIPVALMPTEIEMMVDSDQPQILDYRRKYLPTNQVAYHTPPKFGLDTVEQIRHQAESIFKLFNMRDFVRLDGWILPNGKVYFTDINPISGLEQNSFLFRQTSVLGMTHQQTLHYIIQSACKRANLSFKEAKKIHTAPRLPVYVLFGNHNAERQVSLMSGTNVWLKLLHSDTLHPIPCLYDHRQQIWPLSYSYALNHTVEEVYQNCVASEKVWNKSRDYIKKICQKLEIDPPNYTVPNQQKLDHFLSHVKQQEAFVFIAMHGAEGENGTLQNKLEHYQLSYNGSNSQGSAICMDKYMTGKMIEQLAHPAILSLPKARLDFSLITPASIDNYQKIWAELCDCLNASQLVIKPRADGCSAGIVMLNSADDLMSYGLFIQKKAAFIPPNTFSGQKGPIDLPLSNEGEYLVEPYLETDRILIENQQLVHIPKNGWLELTVGVIEHQGQYQSLNPSITVAEGSVLSLEEKFQGGTGVNLTPPPLELLSFQATEKVKVLVEKAAEALHIKNYARLDIFFNRLSEKMLVIEANTLPALTPSTVLYHQALAEDPPLTPKEFIEKIVHSKLGISSLTNQA